jgi:hypothetical protein
MKKTSFLVISLSILHLSIFSFAKERISYDRKAFGSWIDIDHDCQNTRAELLIASSIEPVNFKAHRSCVVTEGFWFDPYSGQVFTRARDLDIDHVIPLKFAFVNGGASWSNSMKRKFANDPKNLIAVSKKLNRSKGSKGYNEWIPTFEPFICDYLLRWKVLLKKYQLRVRWNNFEEKFKKNCLSQP